jgi:hypothetical protein
LYFRWVLLAENLRVVFNYYLIFTILFVTSQVVLACAAGAPAAGWLPRTGGGSGNRAAIAWDLPIAGQSTIATISAPSAEDLTFSKLPM